MIDEVVNGYQFDTTGTWTNATYHHDRLQSVQGLSGHDGTIISTQTYTAFGESRTTTGTSNNTLKYTGRELDTDSGLYQYRARYYDPSTGRFISEDPKGFGAGINFYAYTSNNPVNANDPSGLRADVYVTPRPNGQQGYTFSAIDDQNSPLVNGRFNVTTDNSNPLRPGDYTLTPRPHIEVKTGISGFLQTLNTIASGNLTGNVNRHEGVPQISNNGTPGVVKYADGVIRGSSGTGPIEIHPGRDPITGEGGNSFGCLVCNNVDYGQLNQMLQNNYSNGGAYLHMLAPETPAPASSGATGSWGSGATGSWNSSAAGGFLLYPNKANTNMLQSVYAK